MQVKEENILNLSLSEIQGKSLVKTSLKFKVENTLRDRSEILKLDCKIRGQIGSNVIKNWIESNGFVVEDEITMGEEGNLTLKVKDKPLKIVVKTSLIPDIYGTISKVLENCDVKILKYSNKIEELSGDIFIQIYFPILRKVRDNFIKNINLTTNEESEIFDKLKIEYYLKKIHVVGWVSKEDLTIQLLKLPINQRSWSFFNSYQSFWKCNLVKQAKSPNSLIDFLKLKQN